MGASTDAAPKELELAADVAQLADSINTEYLRLKEAHVRHLARQGATVPPNPAGCSSPVVPSLNQESQCRPASAVPSSP
jgi:hypothetical protein